MPGYRKYSSGETARLISEVPDVAITTATGDGDVTITIPSNEIWEIYWIFSKYTTSADAGSRRLMCRITDSASNLLYTGVTYPTAPASGVYYQVAQRGITQDGTYTFGLAMVPWFAYMTLPGASAIRIFDYNAIATANDTQEINIQYARYRV